MGVTGRNSLCCLQLLAPWPSPSSPASPLAVALTSQTLTRQRRGSDARRGPEGGGCSEWGGRGEGAADPGAFHHRLAHGPVPSWLPEPSPRVSRELQGAADARAGWCQQTHTTQRTCGSNNNTHTHTHAITCIIYTSCHCYNGQEGRSKK